MPFATRHDYHDSRGILVESICPYERLASRPAVNRNTRWQPRLDEDNLIVCNAPWRKDGFLPAHPQTGKELMRRSVANRALVTKT